MARMHTKSCEWTLASCFTSVVVGMYRKQLYSKDKVFTDIFVAIPGISELVHVHASIVEKIGEKDGAFDCEGGLCQITRPAVCYERFVLYNYAEEPKVVISQEISGVASFLVL